LHCNDLDADRHGLLTFAAADLLGKIDFLDHIAAGADFSEQLAHR
jgi:hypothetical protein